MRKERGKDFSSADWRLSGRSSFEILGLEFMKEQIKKFSIALIFPLPCSFPEESGTLRRQIRKDGSDSVRNLYRRKSSKMFCLKQAPVMQLGVTTVVYKIVTLNKCD